MFRHDGYGPAPWMFLVMGMLWVVLIGALIAATIALLTRRTRQPTAAWIGGFPGSATRSGPVAGHSGTAGYPGGPPPGPAGPLSILDERLARGEIDIATFRALRAELTRTDPSPPGAPGPPTVPLPPPPTLPSPPG